MKALVLVAKDQALSYQDVPNLENTEGYSIIKLKAAALNHRDVWIQKGQYGGIKYPSILGSDGAGIDENGKPVIINPSINWGENPKAQGKDFRILGLPDDGTFAEYIRVETGNVVPKPKHLNFEQAAALPLGGLTAYRALFTKCAAKMGEKVLISGIGGGVALFAMQFAIAAGCDVWVTSGSDEKIERAKTMGAKGGFNYRTEAWAKEATAQTGGFDVIIDSAAGAGFADLVKVCKPAARISFFGGTTGSITGVSPQIIFYKQIAIFGTTMGTATEFSKMVKFVSKHKIIPVVDSIFDLKDGNEALKRMDEGKQFGKIVLKIK
jgi:zinc-binding alcohol dehydrogenase/oxidoreductase